MRRAAWLLAFLALVYLTVVTTVYRFLHPEQTETELFFNIPDAVLLR